MKTRLRLTAKGHLRHGEILPNADPRAAIEWHIMPCLGRPMIPPIRTEHCRIRKLLTYRRIQVRTALHCQCTVYYCIILEHCNVRLAGECGVLERRAQIIRYRWVQPKRLVDRVCEVCHVLQILVYCISKVSDSLWERPKQDDPRAQPLFLLTLGCLETQGTGRKEKKTASRVAYR